MSRDDGIYILKLKDQYRVKHLSAIENIDWSDEEQKFVDYAPHSIVRMFDNAKALFMADGWINERAIIRCKDCESYWKAGEGDCFTADTCSILDMIVEPDDFCCWARRKDTSDGSR